jgi:hypothetical protein
MLSRSRRGARGSRSHTRSRASAALALALTACGASTDPDDQSSTANFSGLYRGTQVDPAGSCEPRALPAPLSLDTTRYLSPEALRARTTGALGRVGHVGSTLTLVFSDTLGGATEPPIAGTVQADGSFTQTRTLLLGREGPRVGTDGFYIEQRQTAQGRFERVGTETRWSSAGAFTYDFHDGSPTGTVYARCTRPFTWTATRIGS